MVSLRYVGHAKKFKEPPIIHGDLSAHKFTAYFVSEGSGRVEAVMSMQNDPNTSAASELMMSNRMPSPDYIQQHPNLDLYELFKQLEAKSQQ